MFQTIINIINGIAIAALLTILIYLFFAIRSAIRRDGGAKKHLRIAIVAFIVMCIGAVIVGGNEESKNKTNNTNIESNISKIEKEQAKLQSEAKKLAEEKKNLDAQAKAQNEEQAKLDAQTKKLSQLQTQESTH